MYQYQGWKSKRNGKRPTFNPRDEEITLVKVELKMPSLTTPLIYYYQPFLSEGNRHLKNRFCGIMSDPSIIFNIVLDSLLRSIGSAAIRFLLSGHPLSMSINQVQLCLSRGLLKSLTSNKR